MADGTTTSLFDRRFFNDQVTVLSLALVMLQQNNDMLNNRNTECTPQQHSRLDYWQDHLELKKFAKAKPVIRCRKLKRLKFATDTSGPAETSM